MRLEAFAAILVCLASAKMGAAQAPTPASGQTPQLSLSQAVAIAIKNHPQIAAAQNVAYAAGQRVIEARAPYYPQIDGEVTASQGLSLSRLGAGSLSASLLFNRFGQGIQVSQLVTDFGRTQNLVQQSKYRAQAADQTTQATIFDVVLAVNRAYYDVLEAQAFVKVAEDTVNARQTLADQVSALANAKLKSNVDVSFAQVNLSEARLLLIRSQDAVKRAYADLAKALGQDVTTTYQLEETSITTPPPKDLQPLVAEAIQNRPELRELRLQVDAARSFEQAEADLSRPNVSMVGVGGALPYLNQDPRVAPHGYEAVGVNVDIPIFNGHLFSARRQAAHYESLAEDQRLRDLQQSIERDVQQALISASTSYERIPVTQDLLTNARLALDLAQGRYNLGLASIVEITQAQLNLTQAQIENVTAQYDYASTFADLQYTIGALH